MRHRRTLTNEVCIVLLKIIWVYPFKLIWWLLKKIFSIFKRRNYYDDFDDYEYQYDDEWEKDEDNEQEIDSEINKYANLPEIPEMAQIFIIDDTTSIGVQFVSMCPDETAHIRVIGETSFSQLYKRRVYRDGYRRYFKLNNEKYYLRNSTTQPINPIQAKEGK